MTTQWGIASRDELGLIEPGSNDPRARQLAADEVAVASCEAAIYGTRRQLVAMATRIVAKWGRAAPRPVHMARDLPPSEYLVFTLLVASAQLGERDYTFPATVAAKQLRGLMGHGLVVIHDQQLDTITASLTAAGRLAARVCDGGRCTWGCEWCFSGGGRDHRSH